MAARIWTVDGRRLRKSFFEVVFFLNSESRCVSSRRDVKMVRDVRKSYGKNRRNVSRRKSNYLRSNVILSLKFSECFVQK